jgi:hypothetical protein
MYTSSKMRKSNSLPTMVALVFKCTVKKSLRFSYFGYTRKRKANGQQFGRGCAVEPAFKQHKFTPLENNDIVVCAQALYDHYDNLLVPISLEYESQKEILDNAFEALTQTTVTNRDRYHDFLDPASRKVTEDLQILDLVETQRKFKEVEQDVDQLEAATKKFRIFWNQESANKAQFFPTPLPKMLIGALNSVNCDFFGKVKNTS